MRLAEQRGQFRLLNASFLANLTKVHAVDQLIASLEAPRHNGGPPLDGAEEAIEHLRVLRRALSELLAAADARRCQDADAALITLLRRSPSHGAEFRHDALPQKGGFSCATARRRCAGAERGEFGPRRGQVLLIVGPGGHHGHRRGRRQHPASTALSLWAPQMNRLSP